jgi:crotonyl-CoA carboxylase/reductase
VIFLADQIGLWYNGCAETKELEHLVGEEQMSQKTVSDLMHKGVIACSPETTMDEIVRIISDTSVHAIVVMDDSRNAVGMVSHIDIIRLFGEDLPQHTANDVMSDTVIAIESHRPAKEGADLMLNKGVDHLLVIEVDKGNRIPVGVLSTTDLIKEMRGIRWIWHMG